MLELIKESDLDTVRHFYRALAGTEFCAWTDIYPGEPELQSDFSRDSLFCIRDDVSGEIAGLVSIDDDPEVESIACWSEELQPSAEISRLGVAEKYQNRGIARELLAGAMEELRRRLQECPYAGGEGQCESAAFVPEADICKGWRVCAAGA